MNFYSKYFKRLIDFILALTTLLIISPIVLAITLLLMIQIKGNPFFIQSRPGLNSRIFNVIKFKTMYDEKDQDGKLLPDEIRLTKIGKFVRANSLDELPQLINVLKGDMSFIGPRPLLPKYLSLYNSQQLRRHEVRPGITGWAQVNGRNNISWQKKFELDVWYIDNLSIWLDLKIILLTVKKVLIREGISKEGNATTDGFNGHN